MATAWSRRGRWLISFVVAVSAVAAGGWWLGNRTVDVPTLAERQERLNKAIDWVLANEARLTTDTNMPLWHMLQYAATISHRNDLIAMVDRAILQFGPAGAPKQPWVRFVRPHVDLTFEGFDFGALYPDQKAFFSALTCGAYDQLRLLPDDWRHHNVCRPSAVMAFVDGGVCSTHQLMALMALQRQGCTGMPWDAALVPSLQEDIRLQLQIDPLFRDRYVQRVLMLWWTSGEQAVRPVWLRRVMDAQHDDGRWSWTSQLPELPASLQPWALWAAAAQRWPQWVPPRVGAGDFHTTAQGLLLMALAVQSAQASHGAVTMSDQGAQP
jgi:hypothetical protein